MVRVVLFGEDGAHETFVKALARRIGLEEKVGVSVVTRSSVGGRSRLINSVREFATDVDEQRVEPFDLLIVTTDANCQSYRHWNDTVRSAFGPLGEHLGEDLILVTPDPHIERWMLVDSEAFRRVFGRGCAPPDQKCERDRYKKQLLTAIQGAGIDPPLGGMEYAKDVVVKIDLDRVADDESFGDAVKMLRRALRRKRTRGAAGGALRPAAEL